MKKYEVFMTFRPVSMTLEVEAENETQARHKALISAQYMGAKGAHETTIKEIK